LSPLLHYLFSFSDPATTELYTLSLHDALPILTITQQHFARRGNASARLRRTRKNAMTLPGERFVTGDIFHAGMQIAIASTVQERDRKSTRLNSSHRTISYAVFCLKKKKKKKKS